MIPANRRTALSSTSRTELTPATSAVVIDPEQWRAELSIVAYMGTRVASEPLASGGHTLETGAKTREALKLAVRKALLRANLDIGRDPASARLSRTLSARGITTVLDVGANMGQFARIVRAAGFLGTIHSFEPLPDAYAALASASETDPMWLSHNLAVGQEAGMLELNVAGNSFSSSVLPMSQAHLDAAPASAYVDRIVVKSTTVADLLGELAIDPASTLLKIDTQGYEMPVLAGAGQQLASFAAVQVEMSFVALYEGQILFDPLKTYLEQRGFELFSLEPGIAAPDGRLLQADGLFVRAT